MKKRPPGAGPLAGFALETTLPFLVHRVGAHLARAFEAEVAAHRLTVPMWRVLAALGRRPDQGLLDLARATSVDFSTLSRQVAALVRRGLVVRRRDPADGRALALALTPRGRRVGEALLPVARRYERVALGGIGGGEARRLKSLLARVYGNVQALGPGEDGLWSGRRRLKRGRRAGGFRAAGDPE